MRYNITAEYSKYDMQAQNFLTSICGMFPQLISFNERVFCFKNLDRSYLSLKNLVIFKRNFEKL